jgi:hypothetical protein
MKLFLQYYYIIIITIIIISLYFFIFRFPSYEGMQINRKSWTPELTKRFLEFQNQNQNTYQYNLKVIQSQATPEEVEHLLETGYWPWSDEIKYLYMDAIFHNKIIKVQPDVALENAMKIYNENAVKKLLSWNTNEGQFLLYGYNTKQKLTDFNYDTSYSIIKCDGIDNSVMKKYTYYASNGYLQPTETIIDNQNIPNEIDGFQFYNNICNPCNVFVNDGIYNCPFTINKDNNISTIWRKLWNI